jgi:polyphosphate glucokinase
LKWKEWAARLDEYMHHLEFIFSPNIFVLGGGISKQHNKFIPLLTVKAKVVPAKLRNEAGIIGAAMAAYEGVEQ